VDRGEVERWLLAYERAWRTPGTDSLGELFGADATYKNAPYEPPYRRLDAIAEMWERERTSPDEVFEIDSDIVAVEDNTGVAKIEVRYGDPVEIEYRRPVDRPPRRRREVRRIRGMAVLASRAEGHVAARPGRLTRPARGVESL
jgi:hypothetical protein